MLSFYVHPTPLQVVHKEGWVYVNAPLGEEVMRIVEDCYGFQLWRGEQDHFFNDVVRGGGV